MRFLTLVLGALAASSLAAPAVDHVLHERRELNPSTWSEGKRLDASTLLPVRIGLIQNNLDRGHDLLMEMSNPASTRYGKHMSASEVHEMFAPSQESVDGVLDWLKSSGIASHRISQSHNKQWIQFDAPTHELEKLLKTEYYMYSHSDTGKSHISCRDYHVPRSVSDHIDYITPGVAMREVTGMGEASSDSSLKKRSLNSRLPIIGPILMPIAELLSGLADHCVLAVTPDCIKNMYNITDGDKATKGNELGVFETINQLYAQKDLDLFFESMAKEIPAGTHPILKSIDGGEAPAPVQDAGAEADLDFQVSYPIIWPQNSILYQTDDMYYERHYHFTGFLNTFLDAVDGSYCDEISPLDPPYPDPNDGGYKGQLQCGVYKPPTVLSISYGSFEASLPVHYQRRQCNEWMKLGMQGVSVVAASGDSGVGGLCQGPDRSVFSPDFPASCPYITAVGSTTIPVGGSSTGNGLSQRHDEVATDSFGSGGGFSNVYKRPDYQKKAVEDFFGTAKIDYKYYETSDNASVGANGGIYNRIGRGYPDVSALGEKIVIFNQGLPVSVGGTSASCPIFASILTRINEERLAVGKSTVGFVNPVLYEHPEVFYDITKGSNSGCGTAGFSAIKGWDPVTGLGSPNYPALLDVFMKMP